MKIIKDLSNYKSFQKSFVTIGTFDGVHIGHQKVIKNLICSASGNNVASVLFTFFPHPRMVLQKESDIELINTIDERIQLLEKLGLEIMVIQEFTTEFSKYSALHFVENLLVGKLNLAKLIIGYDHQFGKNREGDFEQLTNYGSTYGFSVEKIQQLDIDSITVSSSKIRTALKNGEIEKANRFLGYNFMLTGKVVKGENLGKKIGFPTANLNIAESYKLIPKTGAYIVSSKIEGKTIYGMMNIGYRPTVSGKNQTIEIHFFDFNDDLYGVQIQVDVIKFLRDEQKFESVEALKNQLQKDKEKVVKFISGTFFDS